MNLPNGDVPRPVLNLGTAGQPDPGAAAELVGDGKRPGSSLPGQEALEVEGSEWRICTVTAACPS